MVVTRRAPVPVPTSRTNSSQPIPRLKSKSAHDSTQPSTPSPLVNGVTGEDVKQNPPDEQTRSDPETDVVSKQGKQKNKAKQKKADKKAKKKRSKFVDFLTRIFLLWFTIYTLSVCPTDEKLQSPVCRGLHYYRQLVLEPFILPPIKLALSHPFVAPYVDRATPYANQLVSATKPIALRTKAEWNARVIPQWNKRIVPMWNTHVVSQWSRLAVPHITRLEHQFQPYQVRVVQEYERRLGPRLRLALFNMQKWQRQARPYFIFAVNKTYDAYQKTKPYAIPVLQRLKTQFSYLVRFLVAQRRQYVDPHVKKIWDRVIELSGGKSRPTTDVRVTTDRDSQPASPASSVERPTSLSSSLRGETDVFSSATPALPVLASRSLESFESASVTSKSISPQDTSHGGAEDTKLPTSSKDTASTATSSAPKPNSSAIPSVSDEYDLLSSSLPEYDNTVPSEPLISSSVDTFQAESASSAPSSIFSRASESIIDTVSAPSPSSTVALPSGSAHSSNAANRVSLDRESTAPLISPSASPSPYESDELDLDAFYAELGLGDDPLASTSSEGDESAPPIPTESEEDKAERIRLRQEQTAKKRADITGRHSLWESQLEERIVQNSKILRRTLVSMRKAAVSELKDSVEIRKEVESLVEEAEKYIKSAEKYLVSLRREPRKKEDKRALWTRVVERVDDKFGERLGQTEAVVNGWYNQILNKELEEVRKLTDEVKDIADRAQADIGLDYAWLDDVTYDDWQRYHDLVRRSDNFTARANSIQNGTHPSPPINPVIPALEDIQSEVQDIVVGFETRIRGIKRKGERAFEPTHGGEPETDDVTGDGNGAREKHEEVRDSAPPVDIPHIVIGRNKEEVMEALNRVAEQHAHATSDVHSSASNPEQVVEQVVHEVEDQVSHPAPSHEEL